MTEINDRNYGQATKLHLAAEPVIKLQSNNSLKVFLTGVYDSKYGKNNKTRELDLQAYVPPAADGSVPTNHVYSYLTKGSPISVMYETYKDPYTDSKGVKRYPQISEIRSITLLETSAAGAERRARVAAAKTAQEPPAAAPVTQAPVATENIDPLA